MYDGEPEIPPLYNYSQAAVILGAEESWLRRNIKRLPHVKMGRRVRFTAEHLRRIIVMHCYEPGPQDPAAVGGSHPLRQLKPLPLRRRA